jgi:hypothetical protein
MFPMIGSWIVPSHVRSFIGCFCLDKVRVRGQSRTRSVTRFEWRQGCAIWCILQTAEFREKVLNTGNEPVGLGLSAFQAQ